MADMRSRRHESAEIRRLLEVRRSEKLTFQQLSERSGIPIHVFSYRAAQDRRKQPGSPVEPSGFVEVVAAGALREPEAPGTGSGIELHFPGGFRVVLDREFSEASLARLLSAAGC